MILAKRLESQQNSDTTQIRGGGHAGEACDPRVVLHPLASSCNAPVLDELTSAIRIECHWCVSHRALRELGAGAYSSGSDAVQKCVDGMTPLVALCQVVLLFIMRADMSRLAYLKTSCPGNHLSTCDIAESPGARGNVVMSR